MYKTVGNGWLNKNEKVAENPKLPIWTGKVKVEMNVSKDDEIQVALWERNGSYSMKVTKHEEE